MTRRLLLLTLVSALFIPGAGLHAQEMKGADAPAAIPDSPDPSAPDSGLEQPKDAVPPAPARYLPAGTPAPAVSAAPAEAAPMEVEEPEQSDMGVEEPKNEPRSETQKQDAMPPLPVKPETAAAGETGFNAVLLQGLNKVTAHAEAIEAPIGSAVRFGTIEIVAHSCWKAAPEERPENAALLEISEIKQGEPPRRIFLGWMFSSSPALSALEHPFYDVTVVKCVKKAEQ